MKKFLLMMTVALALFMVGCNDGKDSKAKGQELSKELNDVVQKNDTASALSIDESIREVEANLVASGDTASLTAFRTAMKDARVRNAAFVTVAKIKKGVKKNDAVKELMQDALNDNLDIHAITSSIDAILKYEEQNQNNNEN